MEKWALRFIDRNINQMPVSSVALSNIHTSYICGIRLLLRFYPHRSWHGCGNKRLFRGFNRGVPYQSLQSTADHLNVHNYENEL